jgi:hypothetical protein
MRSIGATGPTKVQPLKKEKAIEVGAEILGEAFVYTVAASIIMLEYWRSSHKEAVSEAEQDRDIDILQDKLQKVEDALKKVESRVDMMENTAKNDVKKK